MNVLMYALTLRFRKEMLSLNRKNQPIKLKNN